MKNLKFIFIVFLLFLSCKTLENITSDITQVANQVDSFPDEIEEKYKSLKDSVSFLFRDTTVVRIPANQSRVVEFLRTNPNDTFSLARINIKAKRKSESETYTYNVYKNDIINFKVSNMSSNKYNDIIIREGDEIRASILNLKRNKSTEGSFFVKEDNTLNINVKNNHLLLNSRFKLNVKRIFSNYTFYKQTDSIETNEKIYVKKTDTLFEITDINQFKIAPYIDITKTTKTSIPISIQNDQNTLGWGFWASLQKSDYDNYENIMLTSELDPLTMFAKSEINSIKNNYLLPVSENPFVNVTVVSKERLNESANGEKNFNFYMLDNVAKDKLNFEIDFENFSKLYDFNINLKIIKVVLKTQLVEKNKFILKDFYRVEKNK